MKSLDTHTIIDTNAYTKNNNGSVYLHVGHTVTDNFDLF